MWRLKYSGGKEDDVEEKIGIYIIYLNKTANKNENSNLDHL